MPLSRVFWAFLGGSVVKNSPANAGHTGSILPTRWSHKPQSNEAQGSQLLSLCSRAREPQLLRLRAAITEARVLWSLCSKREATARASPGTTTREQPRFAATREKLAQQQRPSTAKNLKHFKKSILLNFQHLRRLSVSGTISQHKYQVYSFPGDKPYPSIPKDKGKMLSTRRLGLNGKPLPLMCVCECGQKQGAQRQMGTLRAFTHSQKLR